MVEELLLELEHVLERDAQGQLKLKKNHAMYNLALIFSGPSGLPMVNVQ